MFRLKRSGVPVEPFNFLANERENAALGLEHGRNGHPELRGDLFARPILGRSQQERLPRSRIDPAHTVTHAWLTNAWVNSSFRNARSSSCACTVAIAASPRSSLLPAPGRRFRSAKKSETRAGSPTAASRETSGRGRTRTSHCPGQPHHHVLCHILGVGTLQASLAAPAVDLRPIISDERIPCRLVSRILTDCPKSNQLVFSDCGRSMSTSTSSNRIPKLFCAWLTPSASLSRASPPKKF